MKFTRFILRLIKKYIKEEPRLKTSPSGSVLIADKKEGEK